MDFLDWLKAQLPSSVTRIFTKGIEEKLANDGAMVIPLMQKWNIDRELATKVILVYRLAEAKGYRFRLVEGWRSCSEQNRRFLLGETNARCGQSPHNPSPALAIDFEAIPASEANRKAIGKIAENAGLIWGGSFMSGVWSGKNKDTWHLELPDWKRRRGTLLDPPT